ncbi:WD40 repeat domain-containing serine/threonine protein kinase [Tundrisphaera lichenicola]|uniref:WD40 repeat domain-containing serine/threonine protein kinase n=1 Tax=Tundrisphaera lichenicola TaxID=2029860 RepID=UPI003EC05B9F
MSSDSEGGTVLLPDPTPTPSPSPGRSADELAATEAGTPSAQTIGAPDRETVGEPGASRSIGPTEGGATTSAGSVRDHARPPRFLGEYEILEELARGGMGIVYRARQVKLNRLVALKLIRDSRLAGPSDLRRFRTEAEAVAWLDHPYIVPIYEVGQVDDQPFFSMKLVEGGNLARHVDRLKDDPRAAALLMAKVARAVQYAHQRAILHRDLKPSNILVDERGEPYVTDFGLAKRLEGTPGDLDAQTQSGSVMGTPAYMSPEQALGRSRTLTTSADIYSLGATLYETLTGQPPFSADSVPEILRMVVEQEPARPRAINPSLDIDLETVALKCLEKDPARRYGSAEALADDLERWLGGQPIEARRVSARERAVKWVKRRPGIAALMGLLCLAMGALIGGGFAFTWSLQRSNDALRAQTYRAETSAYIAEIDLARRSIDVGDIAGAYSQLEMLRPTDPGDRDRRGFEWSYLWRLCGYEHLKEWNAGAPVQSAAYSPDGRRLALGLGFGDKRGFESKPGEVLICDSETGANPLRFEAHTGPVFDVTYSPDGREIATAGADRISRRWSATTGSLLGEYGPFQDTCNGVAFSPDGRRLAVTSGNRYPIRGLGPALEPKGELAAWDIATHRRLWIETEPTGAELAVGFSHDGSQVISGGFNSVQARDAGTGAELKRYFDWGALQIGFHPDRKRLAVSSSNGSGVVFVLESGQPLLRLTTVANKEINRYGFLTDIAFAPPRGDQIVASFGREPPELPDLPRMQLRRHTVRLWDIRGRLLFGMIANREAVMSLAYRPDGERLVTTDVGGGIHLWLTRSERKSSTEKSYPGQAKTVALSPDGLRLAVGQSDGSLYLDDLESGRPPVLVRLGTTSLLGLAFAPDGRSVAVSSHEGPIWIIDAETGRTLRELPGHDGPTYGVAYRPDGLEIASAGDDGVVKLWELPTGRGRSALKGHSGVVYAVAYSPDGRTVASAGGDGAVRFWDTDSAQPRLTWQAHRSIIHDLAFHPDGRSIATAGDDGAVKTWDCDEGRPIRSMSKHARSVWGVTFGGGGEPRLVSVGRDSSVRLWDPRSGQEVLTLLGHESEVVGLSFAANGSRLVTADSGGKVRVWEAGDNPFLERGSDPSSIATSVEGP